MITIQNFVFNPFHVNTYLLYDETGECVIIDAGCYFPKEKNELVNFIEKKNLKPVHLLNTHGHIDHLLGNLFLSEKYKLKPEAHILEVPMFNMASEQGKMFGIESDPPPDVQIYLDENSEITFGHSNLKVLHTPGHTVGSISFYSTDQKFVITGDVLFYESIGRTDLPGGNYDVILRSIKEKLFVLPDDYSVYSGHGQSTTLLHEKKNNRFLI
jgi:glyoxylase-like metal-dependent hydrolase (beta-lactamase superfamily II)